MREIPMRYGDQAAAGSGGARFPGAVPPRATSRPGAWPDARLLVSPHKKRPAVSKNSLKLAGELEAAAAAGKLAIARLPQTHPSLPGEWYSRGKYILT